MEIKKIQEIKCLPTVAQWLIQEFPYCTSYISLEAVVEILQARRDAWVGLIDGQPIGTISLLEQDDLPSPHRGWVADFVVAPAWRYQGYGSQLLSAAIQTARSFRRDAIFLTPLTKKLFISIAAGKP